MLCAYTPPPATVAQLAHVMMIYNGLHHEKTANNCGGSCFREFQKWLKGYER
jgi:hypothetical protein